MLLFFYTSRAPRALHSFPTRRSSDLGPLAGVEGHAGRVAPLLVLDDVAAEPLAPDGQLLDRRRPERVAGGDRSEEHTSELQSHSDLVCRLLLEKKKEKTARLSRSR